MRRSQVIRRTMHKPICPRVGSVFAASLRTGLGEGLKPRAKPRRNSECESLGRICREGDFGGRVNGAQWEAGNVTGCSLGWTAGDHRFSRPVEAEVKGEGRVEEGEEEEEGGGVVV